MNHWIWLSIICFFAFVFVIGLRRQSKNDLESHFGNQSASWWQMCFSITATEASALTFIAVPALSFSSDTAFWHLYLCAFFARPILALFFLNPFFESLSHERKLLKENPYQENKMGRKKALTTYGFIGSRLGPQLGLLSLWGFMCMRLLASGVRLYVGALLVQQLTGLPLTISIASFLAAALVYSYSGGINSVIKTDLVQFMFLLASGTALLSWFGSQGGFDPAFFQEKWSPLNFSFSLQESYTLPAVLLSLTIFDLATHAADFDLFQRLMAGKSLAQAKAAIVLSSLSSALVGFLFLFVGVTFYGFVSSQTPNLPETSGREVYTFALTQLLPTGLKALVVVGLLAACLSSLDSAVTSIETVWKRDLAPALPKLDWSRLWIFTVVAGGLFFVALLAAASPNILELGLQVQSYVVVPILFLLIAAVAHWNPSPSYLAFLFFLSLGTQLFLVSQSWIAWAWGPLSVALVFALGALPLLFVQNRKKSINPKKATGNLGS